MQNNSPYPITPFTSGILDLTATLTTTTIAPHDLPYTNVPPLSFLLLADRLAELYEMIFPDRPEWLIDEIVDWDSEDDVVTAVQHFLERVNTLFPIEDEILDADLEVVEWWLYEIPVVPMGFDEWHNEWDDWKEPIPYLLHLHYSRGVDGTSPSDEDFDDLYPEHQLPEFLEAHHLVETLRQICAERSRNMELPEPLNALPDLLLMLSHNTGNAWLDVGEFSLAEGGGYPQWGPEDVVWLAEEWCQARPILERIYQLLDWQNGTPEEVALKLTAVRDVLLDAYHRTQPAEQTTNEVLP